MKQFGWRQILPPPLHSIPWRDEKSSNVTVDYRVKSKQQVEAWQNRLSLVIDGQYDELVGRHPDEYFAWYHRITRLRVGRPPQGRRNPLYEHAAQQMEIFLKHVAATIESVDEKYDSWFLYKIMQTIQQQCLKFSTACSTGFENFNLEECINSMSYENFNKLKLTWFHKNFVEPPENASEDDIDRCTKAYLFCLVSTQICGFTSESRGHAYLLELFETFQVYAWAPTCLANLYRTLSKANRVKDGIRTICGALQFLQIWAYSRMRIGRPIKQNMENIKFEFPLFKMWEKRLKNHFSLTTVEEAHQQLDQQGIDQHWEQKNLTDYYHIAFGKERLREIGEYEMLFFLVWYQSHFFLVVGYPKREKWHFYNSLDSDVYWKYTRHFVLFITGVFSQFGWDNPTGWPIIPYECPKQDNTDDCGLFVMAYAEHLLLGRPM
ncbi:serine/threonine-protein phosphatase 7 long form [Cinnamomum micranthum f. kanehirae]|uniref:Serine/threonine-protein phosphatase 7 long form n=1 Tax=Cinnamomum micranthum f. kanehirae TaxID=337451 RepID=A0A443N4B6_9MAGN|nr:serine/threonine-protein phosphatase 7 long form [Cinnamomum micranthum f. kanehirae]